MVVKGLRIQFFVMAFLFCLFSVAAAQDITFTATVDKTKVAMNDQLELQLIVSGSKDSTNPELPALKGFEIISSGSSSQFSFINGVMNASRTFTYLLMPITEGNIIIDPATVTIDGTVYETKSISVEVLPAGKSVPQQSRQTTVARQPVQSQQSMVDPAAALGLSSRIFIELTSDKQEAYLGEQIILTFRLYFRDVRIDNLRYVPPVTKGFITEAMGQQRELREIRDGVAYNIIELKTALFPVSSGTSVIEPAGLQCDLLVRTKSRQRHRSAAFDDFFDDSFFFPSYARQPVDLKSEAITVDVKSLPLEGQPDSFRGAVGIYDLTATAEPKTLRAGEPISLVMKVSGSGNIGAVPEPVVIDLQGFKSYDSEIKTEITGREREIIGVKTFQKMIIPKSDKITEIPVVLFSYYDPVKEEYRTIRKGPIPIKVSAAEKKDTEILELMKNVVPETAGQKAIELLARDIHFIKTSPGKLMEAGILWYRNKWLWLGVVTVPLLLLLLCYFYQSYRTRLKEDSAYAKAKSASGAARVLLNEAKKYEKEINVKGFYDVLARVLQKYVSDRLNLPVGSVVSHQIADLLISRGVENEIVARIKKILDVCDSARFGAADSSKADMKNAFKEVSILLGILVKKL